MMVILEEAVASGLSVPAACAAAGLSERRFWYWRARAAEGDFERRRKSVTVRPVNALMPVEQEAIRRAVACAEWADMSCRELSVRIMERDGLYVSPYSIWLYEKRLGLAGHRGRRRRMGTRRGEAPDTGELSGRNQLWAWDITKLRTGVKYRFWYLYAVLDQWSRKVVGWLVSDREDSEMAQRVWEKAILAEGLTAEQMPRSLSDRGPQMRSRSTNEFFRELGVAQLFSRPRTPNDNPFVEALFSTTKTAPTYPGQFPTPEEAEEYFGVFFPWYNDEHLHTRIGMVTPQQKHDGSWVRILAEREAIKAQTMASRREFNCGNQVLNKKPESAIS